MLGYNFKSFKKELILNIKIPLSCYFIKSCEVKGNTPNLAPFKQTNLHHRIVGIISNSIRRNKTATTMLYYDHRNLFHSAYIHLRIQR